MFLFDDYGSSDLFTFLCIYSNVFYKGTYPFGHKLAQLGELPMTPPDEPRLILGALQWVLRENLIFSPLSAYSPTPRATRNILKLSSLVYNLHAM
jgi:hypothetical protein